MPAFEFTDSDAMKASDSLVKRIRLMAQFIHDDAVIRIMFEEYWRTHWRGKAEAGEFLDFLAQPDLDKVIALQRKVIL